MTQPPREALTLSDLARQAASVSRHPAFREPHVLTPEQLHTDPRDTHVPHQNEDDVVLHLVEQDSRHEMSLAELYRKGQQRGLIKPQRQYT